MCAAAADAAVTAAKNNLPIYVELRIALCIQVCALLIPLHDHNDDGDDDDFTDLANH